MTTPSGPGHNYHWFVLGRESLLAAAEIGAVLSLSDYDYQPPLLRARTDIADAPALMRTLGGTIKIARELSEKTTRAEIMEIMIGELKKVEGKIHFGLSLYAPTWDKNTSLDFVKKMGLEIKKLLKEEDLSVRYVENKEAALSSVTVEKNGLVRKGREFLIVPEKQAFALAQTLAVQPFEEFSRRDYGRPGRDDASGMLPPKLAMIMINLAQTPQDGVLLDPFCGSGTILTEAALLGYKNIIGSDISEKAISDTMKNIEWMGQTNKKMNIFQSGVNKLREKIPAGSVDAIVAEPFMGKPLSGRESRPELLNQANELKKLYLSAFAEFGKILKTNGTVVMIIPRFRFRQEQITINCQEEIKKLGFVSQPLFENKLSLTYARASQLVIREIWKFKKK
jgi:tRNA G10  N-methylase Trm11